MSYISFESFHEMLENSTTRYHDQVLFETFDQSWDYKTFYHDVLCFAEVISLYDQSHIKITTEHPYHFSVVFFATIIIGKIAILSEMDNPKTNTLYVDDSFFVEKHVQTSEPHPQLKKLNDNSPCVIIQSSGTTSVSKGVMLSQKNLITELKTLIEYKPFPENEVYYHLLPYTHLFGLLGEFLIPLCTGGKICFADNNITLFRNFSIFKPTYLCIPPAILDSIAKILLTTHDYTYATGGRLKSIISGGAFLNEKTRTILTSYGIKVYIAYGLTECSPVISIERDEKILYGSVGQILPCCNVRIIDDEILVSGNTVMLGYWDDPTATKSVIIDGWLHTGDIGYIDENGYLFLTGRISNLIVFENGKKIIPELLEKEINSLPNVIESLVIEINKCNNSRIAIDIYVQSTENCFNDTISASIKEIISKHMPLGLLNNIIHISKSLKRNSLGKIDRIYYRRKSKNT